MSDYTGKIKKISRTGTCEMLKDLDITTKNTTAPLVRRRFVLELEKFGPKEVVMLPQIPMDGDIRRIVQDEELGLPSEDAPAAEGGFGAIENDLTAAEEALKEEGVLDEEIAEETEDKK